MFSRTEYREWLDLERFAKSRRNDWTYIIFGHGGPTGKSYLYNKLKESGYNAIEIAEDVNPLIDYLDRKNHYFIYEQNKCVVVILNKPLHRVFTQDGGTRYESDYPL